MLLQHVPESERVISKWSDSVIGMLDLSSVGFVIGASHFQSRTGADLELDLELNAKEALGIGAQPPDA